MKGSPKAKVEQQEHLLDLDAFVPVKPEGTRKTVKFKGKKYFIKDFLDVGLGVFFQLMANEEELTGKGQMEQIRLARDNVKLLIPDMPDDVLNELSVRQITRIIEMSTGADKLPPETGSESASGSGS